MAAKLIVGLMAVIFLFGGCSSSDGFSSTWYGYLNPGQMPTVTEIENYYNSYGSYPVLTDEQYRSVSKDPSYGKRIASPAGSK